MPGLPELLVAIGCARQIFVHRGPPKWEQLGRTHGPPLLPWLPRGPCHMPRAAPTHACAQAILTEDASAGGMITREDVATLVCKALFSKKADNKVGAAGGERRNAVGGCRASGLGLGRPGTRASR